MRSFALLLTLLVAAGGALAQGPTPTTTPTPAPTAAPSGGDAGNDTAGNGTDDGAAAPAPLDLVFLGTQDGSGNFVWEVEGYPGINPTIRVQPGQTINIVAKNKPGSSGTHNFQLTQGGTGLPGLEKPIVFKGEDEVTYTFTAPESGSFQYICTIHASSMKGTLTVAAASTGGGGGAASSSLGTINGGTTTLKAVYPNAQCDMEIPDLIGTEVVGAPKPEDIDQEYCAQAAGSKVEPPRDLVLPISTALIALGVVATVWVHRSYKP